MDRQEVMTRIHQMRNTGMSYQAIAEMLNTDGIPTFSGRGQWSRGTIVKLVAKTDKQGEQADKQPDKYQEVECDKQEDKQDKHQEIKEIEPDKQPDKHKNKQVVSPDDIQSMMNEIAALKQMIAEMPGKLIEVVRIEINTAKQDMINRLRTESEQVIVEALRLKLNIGKQTDKQLLTDESGQPDLFDGQAKQDKQSDKQVIENIGKWNIQHSQGYYRAFRKIEGKQIGVYLGKIFDKDKACEKLMEYERTHGLDVSV